MGTRARHFAVLLLAYFLSLNTLSVDGRLVGHGSSWNNSRSSHTSYQNFNTHSQASSHTNFGGFSNVNRSSYYQPSAPALATYTKAPPIGWIVPKNPPPTAASIGWTVPKNQYPTPAYNPKGQNHLPRYNGTGNFGYNNNRNATQASNYPRQQLPAGVRYYSGGSTLPAGTRYQPPSTTTYYPSNSASGTNYYPAGQIPQGAIYYPPRGVPAATQYPSVPTGATLLPPGTPIPAGAVYYPQPPKTSSSALKFGAGLTAGALGGALLGHALTPSKTNVVQPNYVPPAPQSHDGKVIIINNGLPGTVATPNNANEHNLWTVNGAQPAVPHAQPAVPLAAPKLYPTLPTLQTTQPAGNTCVPVRVRQPDPKDATKTIEVEQIACFFATPTSGLTVNNNMFITTPAPVITKDGVILAPFQPINTPASSVPLAPFSSTG